ncbi:murein transglycosylase [Leptospira harrisiae]|uniref:peptidoglycan lytic exotransglycosylase n=1 Tax=Leptospira harrisiae TaxID=2023189 RepID=A0A2N0AKJ5_9LEPT|nr:murein transglycosylase [Leptospira harrisiae]PKA08285.1 murein transglycosylase [Leptospira harrisiae]
MSNGNSLKKVSHFPFRLVNNVASMVFLIGTLSIATLFSEPRQNRNGSLNRTDLSLVSQNLLNPTPSKQLDLTKDPGLESAIKESFHYFQKLPQDTKLRFREDEYTKVEILKSFEKLQTIIHETTKDQITTEIKKHFILIDLSPSDGLPIITGYYEVRINGKTKPEGEYQYPALSPPNQNLSLPENPKFFHWEKWNQKQIWEKYSKPILFLRLTDLHLAQLEGSALVETESKEIFRINYAEDNGENYVSPSIYLKGICPSLKPYHLSNCFQTKPKEVKEAIFKNPRYIFFEKESFPNTQPNETSFGPLGSAGIRLVAKRSVAMDKQIPLGFPILLSFQSNQNSVNNHLVFVHDRGNAITGVGRLDYYLGSGDGVEEIANNLLTKGKVILLLPKKEKTRKK